MMNMNASFRLSPLMSLSRARFGNQSAIASPPENEALTALLSLDPTQDTEIETQLKKVVADDTIRAEELLPVLKALWERCQGSPLRAEITQACRDKGIAIPSEFLDRSLPQVHSMSGPKSVIL